jgi:phage-related protein
MATRVISTKLQLDGEAEYRASLKNINYELGTLKSDLKLTESQFAGQLNSYDALAAKGETLAKIYEQQEKKLAAANKILKEAQDAQDKFAKAAADAKDKIAQTEAALDALAGTEGDTSAQQAELTAELEKYKKELATAEANQEKATQAVNKYQTQANSAEAELNKLGSTLEDNDRALAEAAKSSDGCADSVDKYTGKVKHADEETEKFSDKLKGGLVAGAKAAGAALAAIGTAAVAGVKLLLDLSESTEEYRVAQGKLNTAFQAAGFSTDTASAAYKSLYAVLGDTDNATESAQLLAQLATSEQDVATWADIAAGVQGTFGDALPINSLIEASNETAKVGQVTGALADALNWVGISEDEFNEKLAACRDETERTALITETLSAQYQNATDIFKENNATVMAAREAQAELDDALARLGGTVSDVKTELTAEFMPAIADLVDAFSDFLQGADGAEEALADAIDELIEKATDKLPELLDFGTQIIINIVTGLANAAPSLVEGAVTVLSTLVEGLLEALPQLTEAAAQMVAALVQGIGEALPTLIPAAVEAVTQLVQSLIDNIPLLIEAALQLVTGLAEGIIEAIPVLLEALPELVESLISALLEAVPQIIETGVTLLTALVTNLPTIIQTIIAVLPQIITSVIQTLLTHLPEIIDAGFKLLTALIDNLPEIILTIVEALPEIISAIVKALTDNIPLIVETGVKLLTSLITNLPQIITEIVRAMPEIITGIVNALSEGISQVTEVGANIVRGLWNGIQSLAGWLWDQVSSWASGIWDGICDFFQIASPSKKMAWVGSMLVEGLAGAIDKDGDKAVAAVDDMATGMIAEVESEMAKVNASLADGIGDIETGFTARATIQEVAASIPSSLNAGRMGAGATAGGETTVTNHFHIAALQVREEADVKKVAKELYNMQKTKTRSKGVVT